MYIESDSPINVGGNNGYGNGGFFNGDGIWAIILFAMIFGNNGWGFGGNGGFGGGAGNMLYDINANTNRGFDNLALNSGIDNLHTAVTSGFANAEVARCNSTTNLLQAINGLSSQFCQCCGDNKLGIADLKYTVATENCADRQALNEGIRDIIASNTANTQAILDKLNAQTLEAKNDEIAQLRQEVLFARGQASQIAQNEQIVNQIYNRLDTCPVGTTPVYGRTPIFTCNNGCGCGNIQ